MIENPWEIQGIPAKLYHNIKVGNKSFESAMKFKCWSQFYD